MKSKTTKQEELREELMDILIECHGIDPKEASCIVDGSLLSLLHQQKKELLKEIENKVKEVYGWIWFDVEEEQKTWNEKKKKFKDKFTEGSYYQGTKDEASVEEILIYLSKLRETK